MGACCATDSDSNQELRTIEDKGLLVIEFGDTTAHWSDIYPNADDFDSMKDDYSVKLKGIDSRHKSGWQPLAGIRFVFTNGTQTPWFETELAKKGEAGDIEELSDDIDTTREIREISMRLSLNNALCALNMTDEKGDSIVDIEWETCEHGREWKAYKIPPGHSIIGAQANTTNDGSTIQRLAFVLRKNRNE